MTTYALYLESGPKRRTTMVHVFDPLGCCVAGPTTEAALEATPDAIRAYLAFLQQHGEGEGVDPKTAFDLEVVQHVTEGPWLGYGDPQPGFVPDFPPLTEAELARHVRRFRLLGQAITTLLSSVPADTLDSAPEGERSLRAIAQHLSEAQGYYLRYLTGKVDGVAGAQAAVRQSPELVGALTSLWTLTADRLAALTPQERGKRVPHGQVTWTARRALRRSLEHAWEHLQELERRLVDAAG